MIEYKDGYAYVDGYKFRKDSKSGYYLSGVINGKRYRLHRYIYEKENGEIPKGYDIHHIDHNKDNNYIDNLKLMKKSEHLKVHGLELSDEEREKRKINFNENARPKAIEWHKSEEGREWHKEQYKISLGNLQPIKYKCLYCEKVFYKKPQGINKFCSNKCKSAYRRKIGVDNVERQCVKCGTTFTINKYYSRQTCDDCKSKRYKKSW